MLSDNAVITELNKVQGLKKRTGKLHQIAGGHHMEVESAGLLYSLVRVYKPEIVFEAGCHKGYSTLHIAQALKDNGTGTLYTCDIKDYCVDITNERLKSCGLDGIAKAHLCKGDELPGVIRSDNADMAYIDSSHSDTDVQNEWRVYSKILKPGGIMILHDVYTDKRVGDMAPLKLYKSVDWEKFWIKTAIGLAIIEKP